MHTETDPGGEIAPPTGARGRTRIWTRLHLPGLIALTLLASGAQPARSQSTGPGWGADRPGIGDVPGDVFRAVKHTASDFAYIYTAPLRLNVKSLLWTGGILAVGGLLYATDLETYHALKRNEFEDGYKPIRDTGEFFEPVGFQGFTNQYLIAALVAGYVSGIDPLRQIPADILESFIITAVGKEAANRIFGRRGPADGVGPRRFGHAGGRSFPSGHSVAITTVATVLAHHVRWTPFRIAVYGMAGTVLLQRMTSDHHWASDVFFGSVFAYVVTKAILKRKEGRRLDVKPTAMSGGGMGLAVGIGF